MNRFVTWVTVNDDRFFLMVNQQMKCKVLDFVLPRITHVGGALFTLSSLFILIVLFPNDVRYWALQGLASLTISHVIVHIIKKAYCRPRPYAKLSNVHLCSNPLKDYSFPSGHTTAITSIAIIFSYYLPLLALFLLPIAALVGISRMYLGLHYPTDCIIGAMLGVVSSIFVVLATNAFF
ncbi:phosphatase PAP2 family protein [Evansella halocellulosilytica]|uniref:phosphatase PAP2 family protein n=1 Tax=Evansella halocellulosilytica TaxID=2011013 RepID=UPI000BB6B14D|nr:phosphatase PAP2 family protein [Evansella halocellulosilytica]